MHFNFLHRLHIYLDTRTVNGPLRPEIIERNLVRQLPLYIGARVLWNDELYIYISVNVYLDKIQEKKEIRHRKNRYCIPILHYDFFSPSLSLSHLSIVFNLCRTRRARLPAEY